MTSPYTHCQGVSEEMVNEGELDASRTTTEAGDSDVEIVGEVIRPIWGRKRRASTLATGSGTSEDPVTISMLGFVDIQGEVTSLEDPSPKRRVPVLSADSSLDEFLAEKEMEMEELKQRLESFRRSTEETLHCAICIGILHRPVVLAPCAHRFCSSCVDPLLAQRLRVPELRVRCPQCRMEIERLTKDAFANQLIENYCNAFPEQKPDPQELEERDKHDRLLGAFRQRDSNTLKLNTPRARAMMGS
uniref:RING-type domain-containing protein n=1 Tax=Steinernema glaseri TaxID=37863 RepID=A0A1I7ZW37_9BILA